MTLDAGELRGTADAMQWALALAGLLREKGLADDEEDLAGLLVGWFANAMETAEKLSATRKGRSEESTFDRSDEIRAAILRSRNRGWYARLLGATDLMAEGDLNLARAIVLDVADEIGKLA